MKSSTFSQGLKKTQKNNVGLVVVVAAGGGGGGCEETKFMAQNVTLTRNATTCEAKCNIKS